jgi:twitching motility protein PilT
MEMKKLLKLSIENKASDLHVIPESFPLMRIDGELIPVKDVASISAQTVKKMIYDVISKEQQEEFEKKLHLETALPLSGIGNFRISIYHQLHGIAAVFRIVAKTIPTFEELMLPQVLKSLLGLSDGLILVTGPAGSGKSTTLAAMIDSINTIRATNIITIEDPIEYIHTNKKSIINQIQVHRDTPTFASALRASLRQDPNVILIGELRDLETIRLALTAAETGHLVMATLHAASAPLAINRMVDIFPAEEKPRVRDLISETIQAICCQMLVKKVGGGRIAAFEIALATHAVRHQIRQDKIAHMIMTMQTSGDLGMCTFEQFLDDLVAKRLVTQPVARNALFNRGINRY